MAGNDTTNDTTTTTNEVSASDEMAQFEGFSTVDGAVQETKEKPPAQAKQEARAPSQEDEVDEGDGGDGEGAGESGKTVKPAQDRINKAVAKQRAAERRADEAERRNSGLERRLSALESRSAAPPRQQTQQEAAPDPKNYDGGEYDARYIADVARHNATIAARAEVARQNEESTRQRQTAAQQQANAERGEKITALTEKGAGLYDDFEEVVLDSSVQISAVVGELVLDSEYGPQIAYALASDPKEQKRVSAMSPMRQAAWFGQREAELSSMSQDAGEGDDGSDEGHEPKPKVTKAPPPPKHNARGVGGTPKASADTTNFSDFERLVMGQ